MQLTKFDEINMKLKKFGEKNNRFLKNIQTVSLRKNATLLQAYYR